MGSGSGVGEWYELVAELAGGRAQRGFGRGGAWGDLGRQPADREVDPHRLDTLECAQPRLQARGAVGAIHAAHIEDQRGAFGLALARLFAFERVVAEPADALEHLVVDDFLRVEDDFECRSAEARGRAHHALGVLQGALEPQRAVGAIEAGDVRQALLVALVAGRIYHELAVALLVMRVPVGAVLAVLVIVVRAMHGAVRRGADASGSAAQRGARCNARTCACSFAAALAASGFGIRRHAARIAGSASNAGDRTRRDHLE